MAVTVEARPAERTARGGEPLAERRILGASFRIYLHRWRPHLAASIIAQGPVLVPTLVVVERLVDVVRNADFQSGDALVPIGGLTMVLLVLAFTSAFLFVLMSGAACQLVELWLQGREVRVIAAYAVAVRRFWRLAGAMLVVCAGLCAGLAALIGVLWFAYLGSLAVLQVDPSEAAADGRVLIILLGLASLAIVGVTALLIDAVVRWAVFVQVVMIEAARCGRQR